MRSKVARLKKASKWSINIHKRKEKSKKIYFIFPDRARKHMMGWERKRCKKEKHEKILWYVAKSVTTIVIGAGVSKVV